MNWITHEDGQEEWNAEPHGPMEGAESFQLPNVKEELEKLGGLEAPLPEMDPDPASFLEELLNKELEEGSVGLLVANDNSEDGALWQEQFLFPVKTEEGALHEEKLNVMLDGVNGADSSTERTVDVHELQNSQPFNEQTEEASHGVEEKMVGVVHLGSNEVVLEQQEEFGTKEMVDVGDNKELEKGSVGLHVANYNSEDGALWQEQFLFPVKTEEGALHEEKLNVMLDGVNGTDSSTERTVDVHELQNSQPFNEQTEEASHGVEEKMVGVVNLGSNEFVLEQQEEFGTKEMVDVGDNKELEKGSVGLHVANYNSEDGALWQEQFLFPVKTEEGALHEEKLNVMLDGVNGTDSSTERTVDVHELQNSQPFNEQTEEASHGVEEKMVGVVNLGSNEFVLEQQEEFGTKEMVDVGDNKELEKGSVGLHVANDNSEDRVLWQEQFLFPVKTEEGALHEEKLNVMLDGVNGADSSTERTVDVHELQNSQPFNDQTEEASHGVEKKMVGVVNLGSNEVVLGQQEEFSTKEMVDVGDNKELEKGSVGLHVANDNSEDCALWQEQFLFPVKTEEGALHEEKLNVMLDGVNGTDSSTERTVDVHELQNSRPFNDQTEEASHGVEEKMVGVVNLGSNEVVLEQQEEFGTKEMVDVGDDIELEYDQEEFDVLSSEVHDGEISSDGGIVSADHPQPKISPEFISEMLLDGCLSVEGLASKGFVFMTDDESGSDEDSDDSSEGEEDEESDEVSSIADSDDGHAMETKSKAKTARKGKQDKEDADEAGPPRAKHELDVLPPVPTVTAVIEPHHKTTSVGHISSVLDLSVIVESSGSERILNESSVLWLTEARVPLGVVDEVFGPVKNPFYVVRFNKLAEIPEDAKTGADVSYVSEFSEFVLKDNPSLYRKAVDASGLDDEELGSDEDLEFSDDEKEAAARMREKSKRELDNREERQGQDSKSTNGQHSKEQRIERGRGRGRNRGRGPATANAVDSAADFVAGMDLQASPWRSTRPGSNQQNGRRWNRGKQNSPRISGHQEPHTRGSRAGPSDGQRSSPQHQGSPQGRDGLYFAEQGNRQMFAEQANRQMLAQQANRQMLAESANRQLLARQANQAAVMQGIPFNAGTRPVHPQGQGVLRQQATTGFQAYPHSQVPGYDIRQGNVYSVPGPFIQNSVIFSNPNLPPDPFLNNQGQGQMNLIHNQGYGSIVHAGHVNYGVPVHRNIGDAHAVVHPSLLGNGVVALDHRNRSVPQNNQNQGPQWHGPNKYYK